MEKILLNCCDKNVTLLTDHIVKEAYQQRHHYCDHVTVATTDEYDPLEHLHDGQCMLPNPMSDQQTKWTLWSGQSVLQPSKNLLLQYIWLEHSQYLIPYDKNLNNTNNLK